MDEEAERRHGKVPRYTVARAPVWTPPRIALFAFGCLLLLAALFFALSAGNLYLCAEHDNGLNCETYANDVRTSFGSEPDASPAIALRLWIAGPALVLGACLVALSRP